MLLLLGSGRFLARHIRLLHPRLKRIGRGGAPSFCCLSLAVLGLAFVGLAGASARHRSPRLSPPIASTRGVFAEPDSALAFAFIKTHGRPTGWRFQWGRTKKYGHITEKPEERAYDGTFPVEVEGLLEPLSPETTYHYRVVAYNAGGRSVGRDRTFRTPAWECGSEGCVGKR